MSENNWQQPTGYNPPTSQPGGYGHVAYGQGAGDQPSEPGLQGYGQGYDPVPPSATTGYETYTPPAPYDAAPPYAQQAPYGHVSPYGTPTPYGVVTPYVQGSVYGPASPRPSVTFTQAVKLALKNYANFSGRASRSEYWYFALYNGLVTAALTALTVAVGVATADATGEPGPAMVLPLLALLGFGIAMFIPSLSAGVRRLHDAGQSGWLFLVSLIPYVGSFILLVMLAQPAKPEGAQYDDPSKPPKGLESL